MSDRLLDAKEVAQLLNVKESWVRDATRDGRLPCVTLGRYRRYDRGDVLAWLESQKRNTARRRPTPSQDGVSVST